MRETIPAKSRPGIDGRARRKEGMRFMSVRSAGLRAAWVTWMSISGPVSGRGTG